jgi:hypothetical protein
MRYEIGVALLSAAVFGAGWAWRRQLAALAPDLLRRVSGAPRDILDPGLAGLVAPIAGKAPAGAIRRRPF